MNLAQCIPTFSGKYGLYTYTRTSNATMLSGVAFDEFGSSELYFLPD